MKLYFLKTVIYILLVIAGINVSVWFFNHINAWVGLAALLAMAVTVILIIIHNLNKKENEKK